MRPTKHMDPSEEELIAHIKESLMSHEESYIPGAWEKFNSEGKKDRGLVFWIGPLSSAAAVLLITAGLYFFINKPSQKEQVLKATILNKERDKAEVAGPPVQDTLTGKPGDINVSTVKATASTREVPDHYIAAGNKAEVKKETTLNEISQAVNTPIGKDNTIKADSPVADNLVPASGTAAGGRITQAENKTRPENKSTNFQEFLKNEVIAANRNNAAAVTASEHKWEMGVVVAPSFGSTKKLNMGYGVSMGYAVSEKVSLGSGISYNELTASRNVTDGRYASPGTSSIAADAKNLESVEARVVGIDVPLELKYHFSKSLYANVGVSAFAVLNQKQSNNYIQEKLIERSDSPVNGYNDFNSFVLKQKTTEEAPKSEVNQDKYLGFYNFSFGYKQKISKTNSISIEPFMKIPMKEVSKENLRLTGTGVRLKFDF